MKNSILKILLLLSMISCKEQANYNPFDEQFDVSVSKLIKDNCDTISAGCGYFNLIKREGKLKPYYQIFIEDFHQVVAKGFSYPIDTFRDVNFEAFYSDNSKIDSLLRLPLNEEAMNKEFRHYGYAINSRDKASIQIVNSQISDTINLELDFYPVFENQYFVRGIEYFKSPPP